MQRELNQSPIIVDHDAGTNPDDSFAFALLAAFPEMEILGVISGNGHEQKRAQLAARYFKALKCNVPQFVGLPVSGVEFYCDSLIGAASEVIPRAQPEVIYDLLRGREKVTWIAIAGLTTLAAFVDAYPECKSRLRVVHMGLGTSQLEEWQDGGTNMRSDLIAARRIYSYLQMDLVAIGSQTTIHDELRVRPGTDLFEWLQRTEVEWGRMLRVQLAEFYDRRGIWPALHDPLTAAYAIGGYPVELTNTSVEFDERGYFRGTSSGNGVNVRTSLPLAEPERFYRWFSEQLIRSAPL